MVITNSQYNQIMRHYDELQLRSRHIDEKRKSEVVKKCPEFEKLEKKAIELSFANTELILSGDGYEAEKKIEELKNELASIREKKRELLRANGFPEDYLDPVHFCKDCNDTGFIGNEKCHCFKQAIVDVFYTQSNVKEAILKENFSTFDITLYSKDPAEAVDGVTPYENILKNYKYCKEFVEKFGKEKECRNLYLYGKSGLGKTFLSHSIANELLKTGHTVLYLTAHQMFDLLARDMRFQESEGSITESSDYIMNCDLLIIDDLGAEVSTSVAVSHFNEVLNERLLKNRSTVISTNLSIGDIGNIYGERNFSRIIGEYTPLRFYGKDIRIKKKINQ